MIEEKMIIAMAVAAIAEENGIKPERVKVCSFKEIKPTGLEKYIEEKHINYHKYVLGE